MWDLTSPSHGFKKCIHEQSQGDTGIEARKKKMEVSQYIKLISQQKCSLKIEAYEFMRWHAGFPGYIFDNQIEKVRVEANQHVERQCSEITFLNFSLGLIKYWGTCSSLVCSSSVKIIPINKSLGLHTSLIWETPYEKVLQHQATAIRTIISSNFWAFREKK